MLVDVRSQVRRDAVLIAHTVTWLREEGVTVKIDLTVIGPLGRPGHRTTLAGFWQVWSHGATSRRRCTGMSPVWPWCAFCSYSW